MTNPNSIVRLHSRNSGRASVLEANMPYQMYDPGLLKGNGVVPSQNADMNVTVGGAAGNPDIVIAETPAGYKIALDIAGTTSITLTAPSDNSKIVAIVAYTDDLSIESTDTTVTGNPGSCGLLAVSGTAASTPQEPTDAQIRTAITADGATGSQAAYAVIAYITVAATTTAITSSLITTPRAFWGMLKRFYPVGSYYETSDNAFDPNKDWGGEWEEDTGGRVLVAQDSGTFSTIGATGGEETHVLTTDEMPKHAHNELFDYENKLMGTAAGAAAGVRIDSASGYGYGSIHTGISGNDGAHNNLQPYIVIKRWHRTA